MVYHLSLGLRLLPTNRELAESQQVFVMLIHVNFQPNPYSKSLPPPERLRPTLGMD